MQSLADIILAFSRNPGAMGKAMRDMAEVDPRAFLKQAIPVLQSGENGASEQYMLGLLVSQGLVIEAVCDPASFSLEVAISLAKRLTRLDPLLDVKLVKRTFGNLQGGAVEVGMNPDDVSVALRLLDILTETSDPIRTMGILKSLLQHSEPRLRSHAVLLAGRSNRNAAWVSPFLKDPDFRVRACAVQTLWGVDSPDVLPVFREAVSDADARTAGNAILGLYQYGQVEAISLLLRMSERSESGFKSSAAWVMGETGDPRFLSFAARMLKEPDEAVRRNAFRSVARLKTIDNQESAGPAWNLVVLGNEVAPDGSVTLRASVLPPDSSPVTGLRGVQFSVWTGSRLLEEYSVEEQNPPEPLVVQFALPRSGSRGEDLQGFWRSAFEDCLENKRRQDAWAVLKYWVDMSAQWQSRLFDADLTSPADALVPASGDRPPIPFFKEADPFLKAVSHHQRDIAARDIADALAAFARPSGQAKVQRHVVLVDGQQATGKPFESFQTAVARAKAASIAVHAISLRSDSPLAQVCSQTGGVFQHALNFDQTGDLLLRLCASLASHYKIHFRVPAPDHTARPSTRLLVRGKTGRADRTLAFEPALNSALVTDAVPR